MKEVLAKRNPLQTNQCKVSLTHYLLFLKGIRVSFTYNTSGSWKLTEVLNYVGSS